MRRAGIVLGASVGVLLRCPLAEAQIHADVDLEAGVSSHFLARRPVSRAAENPDLGPTLAASAHLAVLPLLRAGIYVSHDFSPLPGADLRELTSAGLSLRVFSPWPRNDLRVWLAAGFGYAATYAPSYRATVAAGNQVPATATVSGSAGGFFEVPVGLGSSFQIARSFELLCEVGARIGFGFSGSVYSSGPTVSTAGSSPQPWAPTGEDALSLFVVLGAACQL
jgi:hypothetical protein